MSLILYLLNTLAVNYPILYSMGLVLPYPISLVFPSGVDIGNTLNMLSFWPVIIDSTMKICEARDHIFKANSEAVVLQMPPRMSKDQIKLRSKISMLQDIASLHHLDGKEVAVQVFLAFRCLNYLASDSSPFFEIMLSDSSETIPDPVPVYPNEDDLSVVFNRIKNLKIKYKDEDDHTKLVLNAALAFTYPRWETADRLYEYMRLNNVINDLCRQNAERQDMDSITEMAAELLSSFISDRLMNVVSLSEKQNTPLPEILNSSIFRHGKCLFLSNNLFKQIVRPLLVHTDILLIKRGLSQEGILLGDSGTKYKRTMLYQEGDDLRKERMICLDGSRLSVKDCPGSSLLDFMW